MDDVQVMWLLIGWVLAFLAGKDLQVRAAQWWESRRARAEV